MNILEELYYGNISPEAKCFDQKSKYSDFVSIVSDNEKTLNVFLNGISEAHEEKQLFSELMNAQNEILAFSEQERFIEGFELGARFMLDTFVIPRKSVVRDIT